MKLCKNKKNKEGVRFLLIIVAIFSFAIAQAAYGTTVSIDTDKQPEILFTEAQKAFEKAGKLNADLYAPLELKKARYFFKEALRVKKRIKHEKEPEVIAELSQAFKEAVLGFYFNTEISISITKNALISKKVIETRSKTSANNEKYKFLRELNEVLEKLITERKQLKEKMISLSKKLEDMRQQRANALDIAETANLSELEARREKEKISASLEKAQQNALKALKVKIRAEAEKLAALQEKNEAMEKLKQALLEKEKALRLREEALGKFNKLEQERHKMQTELKLLSAKFARVRQGKRGLIISLSDILFDIGKAELAPGTKENLSKLAEILRDFPDKNILVEGHTDNTGDQAFNKRLSEDRAYAVMSLLISKSVKPERISAKGYGMEKPIASNKTREGRQRNRRVDIVIIDPKKPQ